MNDKKIILDLCAGSGSWSRPYEEAGYDVRRITLPTFDVRFFEKYPKLEVHGILAAPPCTVFSLAGNRWKRTPQQILEGLSVVDACLRIIFAYKPKWWALENPVGKLSRYLGKAKLNFHPYYYGDAYTKHTSLWGEFNLPEENRVEPEFIIGKRDGKRYSPIHYHTPGKDRAAIRAITPAGFANAFFKANQ